MLTSLAIGIRWSVKKAVKENFTTHPSSNSMYYIMFTVVMAAPTTLKQYIRDQKFLPKTSMFWGYYVCSLASGAITICGALLNAVTFIGSNYLACFLSGDDSRPPSKKKGTKLSRLAKPLMPNMKKNKQSCSTELKRSTKTNWPKKISHTTPTTLTNSTTGCTSMSCKRKFSVFYQPSALQNQGKLIFVGTGAFALRDDAFRFI